MDLNQLRVVAEEAAAKQNLFLVDITASADKRFCVYVDGDTHVNVDQLTAINRDIDAQFDREVEDYALEVSSPGMGSAFKVFRQYQKHVGREIKVRKLDGSEFQGILSECQDDFITLTWTERVPKEIGKGKMSVQKQLNIAFSEIKETKRIYNFG